MTKPHPRRVVVTGSRYAPEVPEGAVYAGRSAPYLKRSPYANPHPIGRCRACDTVHDRAEVMRLYGLHLDAHPEIVEQAAAEPAGTRFACRCPLDEVCHVDILLRRVDAGTGRRY